MTLAEAYDITWTEFILRKRRKELAVKERLREIRLVSYMNLRNNWQGKKHEVPSIEKYWAIDEPAKKKISPTAKDAYLRAVQEHLSQINNNG